MNDNVLFDFGNGVEITKRELIASISIIALLLLIGVFISEKITQHQTDKNQIYNKAVKIQDSDMFQYGMETNIGNAFVYGDLECVDTVTYSDIGGKYMSVTKVTERYTEHKETVYDYDEDGNICGSHTETYWSWDVIDSEEKRCKKVTFLGIEFDYGTIYKPGEHYIDTIHENIFSNIRYVYYGSDTKYTGTIFTNLNNNNIHNTKFYESMNIEETVNYLESNIGIGIFWFLWIIFICLCIYGFYYLENQWLE
jgi:hypothetical protein